MIEPVPPEDHISIELYERLLSSIVVFRYEKKDGTLRRAIGTLRHDLIPPNQLEFDALKNIAKSSLKLINSIDQVYHKSFEDHSYELKNSITKFFKDKDESKKRGHNPNVIVYYDFEATAFRSCQVNSIKDIYQ